MDVFFLVFYTIIKYKVLIIAYVDKLGKFQVILMLYAYLTQNFGLPHYVDYGIVGRMYLILISSHTKSFFFISEMFKTKV